MAGITVQLNRDNEEQYGQFGTSEESHIQKLDSYLGDRLSRDHLDHVIRRQRRDRGGSPTGRWVDKACNLLDVLILFLTTLISWLKMAIPGRNTLPGLLLRPCSNGS